MNNKDYKILSVRYTPSRDEYIYELNASETAFVYQEGRINCNATTLKYKINSVLRNSDQQIFTIGDELNEYYNRDFDTNFSTIPFKIVKIELINDQIRFWGVNQSVLLKNAHLLKKNSAVEAIVATKESKVKSYICGFNKIYDLNGSDLYQIRGGTGIFSEKFLKTIAKPYIEPIKQEPIKKSGMKVVVKDKKESSRKLKSGDLIYNRKSDYYGILSINGGAITTTAKVFILKVNGENRNTTLEAFKYLDVNATDCELFEGTITLENEK